MTLTLLAGYRDRVGRTTDIILAAYGFLHRVLNPHNSAQWHDEVNRWLHRYPD